MTGSLGTRAARNLSTTTKSAPQTQAVTPRWLLRMLPWVEVSGGVYRVNRRRTSDSGPVNKAGEVSIDLAAGHRGEAGLPRAFADYELAPREYELGIVQTVLRVHTRVADLYNQPMDQTEQQLRLTIEAVRERQERDLLAHHDFGLLNNVDPRQRLQPVDGVAAPADLDRLLARRRKTAFFLAHPRAIAAFGRQCTARGVYPTPVEIDGRQVPAWRGVPLLPTDKIPVSPQGTSTILAMRIGERDEGVVGLRRTGLPDEREPGLNVRFTGIDDRAVASYLVTANHAVAVLVPDALGALENVQLYPRTAP